MDLRFDARYFRDYFIGDKAPAFEHEKLSLDIQKTAFLLVDVYSIGEFGETFEQAPDNQAKMWWQVINNISQVLHAVRRTPIPVIYMENRSPDIELNSSVFGKLFKRVWNNNLDKTFKQINYPVQLRPLLDEYCLEKHTYSGFFDTRLDSLLRNKGITNIIAVGFWANVCLLATSLDALYRNYNVIWVRDCILAAEDTSEYKDWKLSQQDATKYYLKLFERIIGYSVDKDEFIESCSRIEKVGVYE